MVCDNGPKSRILSSVALEAQEVPTRNRAGALGGSL